MTVIRQHLRIAVLVFAIVVVAAGQSPSTGTAAPAPQMPPTVAPSISPAPGNISQDNNHSSVPAAAPVELFDFKGSDIKFNLQTLMNILRDRRHEGWVLAAYPDPKTGRPLIGAGFSLDLPAREHPQRDPLNPHPFFEPSSAQLWQAAGLQPDRLQRILEQYDWNLRAWTKKRYRRKIRTRALTPQITEEEATRLLRISTIQAIYNAKAYCRDFDRLTASQQMALSQLVYQMGVNLEEFVRFLGAMNGDSDVRDISSAGGSNQKEDARWKTVQAMLIESQWAKRYSGRAMNVIAMFDPTYADDPGAAERRVAATLRPVRVHRSRRRSAASLRLAKYSRHPARRSAKRTHHARASES